MVGDGALHREATEWTNREGHELNRKAGSSVGRLSCGGKRRKAPVGWPNCSIADRPPIVEGTGGYFDPTGGSIAAVR